MHHSKPNLGLTGTSKAGTLTGLLQIPPAGSTPCSPNSRKRCNTATSRQAECEGLVVEAKEISPDAAAAAEISETGLDIIFALKSRGWGVFTALQLASGHRHAANVTPGSLESAKPNIKDAKLALKKKVFFKLEKHEGESSQIFRGRAAANQGPQPWSRRVPRLGLQSVNNKVGGRQLFSTLSIVSFVARRTAVTLVNCRSDNRYFWRLVFLTQSAPRVLLRGNLSGAPMLFVASY